MSGIPCLYYGSEWGQPGEKGTGYLADIDLRPAIAAPPVEAPSPSARGEWAGKDYLPMRPFTMVREILPRALSTPVIHTVTVSPTATTSLGCFTKRSASLEM